MIKHLRDLSNEVGEPGRTNEERERRIARRLYKATDCGISFSRCRSGVTVAGYAEGTDLECQPHYLDYPFTAEAFWKAVDAADQDGCELFDQTHCEACGAGNVDPMYGCDCSSEEASK